MKITFNWRDWWKAERFGVVYAAVLCAVGIVGSLFIGAPELALLWVVMAGFCFIYSAGWQLLCLGILKLRAKLGWIRYSQDRSAGANQQQLMPPDRRETSGRAASVR